MSIGNMYTLSQITTKLAQKGITREFYMNDRNEFKANDGDKVYSPEDLTILKTYRFEGASDPGDNAILYLIEDRDGNKGTLIDAYGVDSQYDGESFDQFVRQIPVEDHDEWDFEKHPEM